jgi:hypothetical protein
MPPVPGCHNGFPRRFGAAARPCFGRAHCLFSTGNFPVPVLTFRRQEAQDFKAALAFSLAAMAPLFDVFPVEIPVSGQWGPVLEVWPDRVVACLPPGLNPTADMAKTDRLGLSNLICSA